MTRIASRSLLVLVVALTALYLALPAFIVVPISFSDSQFLTFPTESYSTRWYEELFQDSVWLESALASLRVAIFSSLGATVLGVLAALALVRGRFPGRSALMGVLLAPLIVPYVIIGLAAYVTFLELGLTETTLGFVLVHLALGVPYVVINVSAGLLNVDPRLEMAARSLGAGPVTTFFKVTLPLIFPSVLTGAFFAFIISWDEVVAAIFLSGPNMTTLPVQMWSGIRIQIDPVVAAVSTLTLTISIAAFAVLGFARLVALLRLRRRKHR